MDPADHEGGSPGEERSSTPGPGPVERAPRNARGHRDVDYEDDEDDDKHDEDDDLTLITLTPPEIIHAPISRPSTPSYGDEEEEAREEREQEQPSAVPIIYDDDAAIDEPTSSSPLVLISAVGQTHLGQKRRKNEDCYLCMDDYHLFAVADGMGGHKGGEVASRLAVETIQQAFEEANWTEPSYPDVPRRGSELAIAIQRANKVVYDASQADRSLTGMGTTLISARFSPNKQRLYLGHVGDSRCYRLREGKLHQLTTDHTMGAAGITGPMANHLSRALGVAAAVKIDLVIARPRPGDVYLLCSDGLSKMANDDAIRDVLDAQPDPEKAAAELIDRANAGGGRDNITVILVRVSDPKDLAQIAKRSS
ncbi:MAG TPA: PP2C family serine/threonine-protein phosphatase [Candidatus Nanopelagicales bacterium]|nr:PP2C family serine/threonine-protein phosphatase [Candidatus Nanopelagicales bacterium]